MSFSEKHSFSGNVVKATKKIGKNKEICISSFHGWTYIHISDQKHCFVPGGGFDLSKSKSVTLNMEEMSVLCNSMEKNRYYDELFGGKISTSSSLTTISPAPPSSLTTISPAPPSSLTTISSDPPSSSSSSSSMTTILPSSPSMTTIHPSSPSMTTIHPSMTTILPSPSMATISHVLPTSMTTVQLISLPQEIPTTVSDGISPPYVTMYTSDDDFEGGDDIYFAIPTTIQQ